jgi:hypothetical protein
MGTSHRNVIYNNIKALCDNHTPRISISKMCVDLGLSKSLGTKLKDNPDKNINGETAQAIANYFGVSVDMVLGIDGQQKKPTPENGSERNYGDSVLMDAFKRADESTQEAILLLLKLK